MGAGGKQRAGKAEGELFDVRVLAFAGGSARTLEGLQELFGLDRAAAQRLMESVPAVVKRGALAGEAQNYAQLLTRLGAEVILVRPQHELQPVGRPRPPPPPAAPPVLGAAARKAPPPPPAASSQGQSPARPPPPPPRRDEQALPRPIMRPTTRDLEFDLVPAGAGGPAALSAPLRGASKIESRGTRNEIEFDAASARLELDLEAGRPAAKPESAAESGAATERTDSGQNARASAPGPREASAARTTSAPAERGGGRPMSKAAVVHAPGSVGVRDPRRRQIALLRVLGALLIAEGGVWFDSSLVYGNASPVSVFAHALAIYQLGVGLRGMAP